MQHTSPAACLSLELLRFVRDQHPTEQEFVEWLGAQNTGRYHVLRKAGLLECIDGQLRLSPRHVTPDGKTFRFEDKHYLLDEGLVRIVRRRDSA